MGFRFKVGETVRLAKSAIYGDTAVIEEVQEAGPWYRVTITDDSMLDDLVYDWWFKESELEKIDES